MLWEAVESPFSSIHIVPFAANNTIWWETAVVKWPDEIKAREVVVGKIEIDVFWLLSGDIDLSYLTAQTETAWLCVFADATSKLLLETSCSDTKKKELKSASVSHTQSYTGTKRIDKEIAVKVYNFLTCRGFVSKVLLSIRNVMVAYRCRRVRAEWHLKDTTSFIYERFKWREAESNLYLLTYYYYNAEIICTVLSDYLMQLE